MYEALRYSCIRLEATTYMYYLEQVQSHDMKSVNESLNGIYIEEEDYVKLNASVSNYTNFDQVSARLY